MSDEIPVLRWEADEDEASRLAKFPVNSLEHHLSTLPVTNPAPNPHRVVRLATNNRHTVLVLLHPRSNQPNPVNTDDHVLIHDRRWTASVVASTDPNMPAGVFNMAVSDAQARRSTPIDSTILLPS